MTSTTGRTPSAVARDSLTALAAVREAVPVRVASLPERAPRQVRPVTEILRDMAKAAEV